MNASGNDPNATRRAASTRLTHALVAWGRLAFWAALWGVAVAFAGATTPTAAATLCDGDSDKTNAQPASPAAWLTDAGCASEPSHSRTPTSVAHLSSQHDTTASAAAAAAALSLGLPVPKSDPDSRLGASGRGALRVIVVRGATGPAAPAMIEKRNVSHEASTGGLRVILTGVPMRGEAHSALEGMISVAARKYGHDVDLLRAIVHVESHFNPEALSPKGAIGLMQVMPATGRRLGVDTPRKSLFDPATNLDAGARYLRLLMDMFPDRPDLAVAAYNAGEGAVLRHRRQVPPFPETQAYVRDVMSAYERYRDQ